MKQKLTISVTPEMKEKLDEVKKNDIIRNHKMQCLRI